MQHRFQNITCLAWHAAPKVYLPTLAVPLVPQPCLTKVSYIARTLPKDISCRAGQVRVLFCLPDCRFLPNSLATGLVVLLHAGQVEIVAIVVPSFFGQSLEDQHMEWKPVGQPEHASLNQCQLIVANRCSGHPQQVVEIRFLCNVIDAGALIGPCSHVTSCCCLIC